MSKRLITLEDFIQEARRLRTAADFCEQAFLDFLITFESRSDLWQALAPTFDKVLDKADICRSSRYRNWVKAKEDGNVEPHISVIGVHAAVLVGRIENVESRRKAVSEMEKSAKRNGVPLSRQSAARIVEHYVAPTSIPLTDKDAQILKLKDENKKLKEENRSLKAELSRFKKLAGSSASAPS